GKCDASLVGDQGALQATRVLRVTAAAADRSGNGGVRRPVLYVATAGGCVRRTVDVQAIGEGVVLECSAAQPHLLRGLAVTMRGAERQHRGVAALAQRYGEAGENLGGEPAGHRLALA